MIDSIERTQAHFRTNPLRYLVHLKYLYLYGDSITCSLMEHDNGWAALLRYPSERVVWDAAAYPTAKQVLLPAASDAHMAEQLLADTREKGLLNDCHVMKFCEADTEAVFKAALPLVFARSLTSYTSLPDSHYEPDAAVRIEQQPGEAHMKAFIANGYSREEVAADFAKGAVLFSLYEGGDLLAHCMTYPNFDDVWEVAGVHTAAAARRKGYARRVVQTALYDLLQNGLIPRYHVEDVNHASHQLAQGLGLQPCLHFTHYLYEAPLKG